jgi:DNA-binding response OmpR family regulator
MDKKKILLADDEEDILSILTKKISENNFECMGTSRGADVLNLAKTFCPDLILLDIAMSDTDGYTIAGELRKEKTTENIPIIFLTGKELDPRSIEERVENLGAYDFLMKPCSFKDLLDKIHSAMK